MYCGWRRICYIQVKALQVRKLLSGSVETPTRCSFVIEFIPKFIEGSTYFERHTAHHQELQTVIAASGLYTHVVTGRCQGWVEHAFVSSGTPLIIRSSKLYLQPLVYIHMWWPTVAKVEWEMHFPLSLGNGRSPHGYINQRLHIPFRAPDDERCAARNKLSLQ
jgi:hypothetical protein